MMKLPKHYQTVMPYLIVQGSENFIDFTKKVFDSEELAVYRTDTGEIMHAEIRIGDSTLMIGESNENWPVDNAGLYINVENADETLKKALDHGASLIMELEDREYGRAGGVRDPFGNTWWITQPQEKN